MVTVGYGEITPITDSNHHLLTKSRKSVRDWSDNGIELRFCLLYELNRRNTE